MNVFMSTIYGSEFLAAAALRTAHEADGRASQLVAQAEEFGALQLKSSAYVLPDQPAHFERFQWLAKHVRDDGGEATLIRVSEIEE